MSSGLHTHPQHVRPLPPVTNFNNCERKNSPARKLNSHFIATKKKSAPYILKAKSKALSGNEEARFWMNFVDEIQKESFLRNLTPQLREEGLLVFAIHIVTGGTPPSIIHKQIVNRQLL